MMTWGPENNDNKTKPGVWGSETTIENAPINEPLIIPNEHQQWVRLQVGELITKGFSPIPYYSKNGSSWAEPYANSEQYPIDHPAWLKCSWPSIRLGDNVLVDYDGYKEGVIHQEELAERLHLDYNDLLEAIAQEKEEKNSTHFLFRRDFEVDKQASNSRWIVGIDIKTANQLMHFKPGKKVTLVHQSELPLAPPIIQDVLATEPVNQQIADQVKVTPEQSITEIVTGENYHENILRLAGRYASMGHSESEVVAMLQGMMMTVQVKDNRWQERYKDIPRIVKGSMDKYSAPAVEMKIKQPEPVEQPKPVVETEIEPIPGVLQDFVDYYNATGFCEQPLFAVQAALALGSVICGRRYQETRWDNLSNLWFMCVGKSGTGKEHIRKTIRQVLNEAGLDIESRGYSSMPGIYNELRLKPNHLTIIDEVGRYLKHANDEGSGRLFEANTELMESFNQADQIMRPPTYAVGSAQNAPQPCLNPCISIIGMTTPSTLFDAIGSNQVSDGYLSRFIMLESDQDAPDDLVDVARHKLPQSVIDWAVRAASIPTTSGITLPEVGNNKPAVLQPISVTDEAVEHFRRAKKAESQLRRTLEKDGLADLANRTWQKSVRVALVLAVSKDVYKPIIDGECAKWAVDYVVQADRKMAGTVILHMVEGKHGKLAKRVMEYIEKGGSKGKTMRDLKRAYGGHGKDLDEVIKIVTTAGRAVLVKVNSQRNAYVSESFLEEFTDT